MIAGFLRGVWLGIRAALWLSASVGAGFLITYLALKGL